jgi:nitroreductase
MDTLEAICSRHSVSPAFLGEPGPDDAMLGLLLDAAARAPDHGCLRAWRFLIIRGDARARLGDLLAGGLERREPGVDPAVREKERAKPQRAPVVVVVTLGLQPDHPKIPAVEQILSAGAAVQNLLLAAQALGIGAKWVTGAGAYDPHVKAGLGLAPSDLIAGLVFLGRIEGDPPAVPHADAGPLTREWTGPGGSWPD